MEVTVWTDYLCPWAYGARPRTDWLVANGATIRYRAYELHPGIPDAGKRVRPGGRLDQVFDHIALECTRSGLPFIKPTRSPNTRRALELLELVQDHRPSAAAGFDALVANAHWVEGAAIDDDDVLAPLLLTATGDGGTGEAGEAGAEILTRHRDGEGSILVDRSRELAHEVGVTATPAWRIGEFTLTGLHPAEQFERWMGRILAAS